MFPAKFHLTGAQLPWDQRKHWFLVKLWLISCLEIIWGKLPTERYKGYHPSAKQILFLILQYFSDNFPCIACFLFLHWLHQTERLTLTFHFHALEKGMATHSSVLAWKIPGTGDPGGLLSMGSHRVGHDWSDLAAAAAAADCRYW